MDAIWKKAAAKLGWSWSAAHNGYISESERFPGDGWASYVVALDAEEACFFGGVETETEARKLARL